MVQIYQVRRYFKILKKFTANDSLLDNFTLRCDRFGRMTPELFIDYLIWFRKSVNIDGPVVFFVDRHRELMTMNVVNTCKEKGIFIVGLYQKANTILEPITFGLFNSLREQFKFLMDIWKNQPENGGKSCEIEDLARIVKETNDRVATKELIQDSFYKTGIYPWNIDNIPDEQFEKGKLLPTK